MKIEQILRQCSKFMESEALDSLYISSFDENISEYVPKNDCHRYYVTGFTGSVAEVLLIKNQKARLYVDGRYHLQADQETNSDIVEVIKCDFGTSLEDELIKDVQELGLKYMGLEGNRCTSLFEQRLKNTVKISSYDQNEIRQIIQADGYQSFNPIQNIDLMYCGESTIQKLSRIMTSRTAFFIQALDSISWICNVRGYHHPYNSTFIGKAICTNDKVFVFTQNDIIIDDAVKERSELQFFTYDEFDKITSEILKDYDIEKIYYDGNMISGSHLRRIESHFGKERCQHFAGGLLKYHAIKNDSEIHHFEESFTNSAHAIYDTIINIKDKCLTQEVNERYFYDLANENYKNQGMKGLSFHTIAAFAENSAIVHFGSSSSKKNINDSELALLDSGAFYQGGLATDCTRTFVPKGKANAKSIEIYTLVLKSLLSVQSAVFKVGTLGSNIDFIARKPLKEKGYSYAHGTGHGVGVNVHEGAYSLRPESITPLVEGLVGSIEPGIYIEGFGGVRLENIVTIVKHPIMPNMLCFKPLIYLGFMPELIDESMLAPEEKIWLDQYEDECQKRGLSFR